MIQWLVGFACRLARSAPSKGPIAAARQIATIFGPIIARSVTSANSRSENNGSSLAKGPEWAICMFELLIHAHGLLEGDEQRSALWKVIVSINNELPKTHQKYCSR